MTTAAQSELSRKAFALREQGRSTDHLPEPDQQAQSGPIEQPRPDYPPSGAFDAEGHRPVLERSRKVR